MNSDKTPTAYKSLTQSRQVLTIRHMIKETDDPCDLPFIHMSWCALWFATRPYKLVSLSLPFTFTILYLVPYSLFMKMVPDSPVSISSDFFLNKESGEVPDEVITFWGIWWRFEISDPVGKAICIGLLDEKKMCTHALDRYNTRQT